MKIKNLLSTVVALLFMTSAVQAQVPNCGTGRYINYVFPNITKTTVTYSTANSTTLQMDIFQPNGDTFSRRPIIILAHGGSFISGTRDNDTTVDALCRNFAKRGYVTASIDYRLASNILIMADSAGALDEVAKAISDAKAAVRFFRKDAYTTNTYKIDTNRIYAGGNSVGAVIYLHIGYVTSLSEYPAYMQTAVNNNGGFDGNSGNAGYSSRVAAVINLAGALKSSSMISSGDVPSFNAQGDADNTIPYYCGYPFGGICPLTVCGLGTLEPVYNSAGITHTSLVFPGAAHVPWQIDSNKFNQIDTGAARFLFSYACSGFVNTPSVSLPSGQSVCNGTVVHPPLTVSGGSTPYAYAWSATGSSLSCNNCGAPSATITQASTYTVTVTDAAHQTATASISYTITPPVSITLQASGPTTFCAGDSVTLSTTLSYSSYHWSTGSTSPSITATQQNGYSLTATNASGCDATGTLTVNVISPPAAQSIVGNPSITPFQSYIYAVNNVANITYTWSVIGGAIQSGQSTNNVNVLWAGTGPYSVMLIQSNTSGCSDTTTLTVTSGPTGLTDITTENIALYPNPNNGTFTLQTSGSINNNYTITDVLGHIVSQRTITSDIQQINMSGASAGVYAISLDSGKPLRFIVAK